MFRTMQMSKATFARFSACIFSGTLLAALASTPAVAQDQKENEKEMQSAQANQGKPAPILVIWREDVKIGHGSSHEKVEQGYMQVISHMPGAKNYIGMKSITGAPQAWFVEPAASFMELQKEREEGEKASAQMKAQMDQLDARESNEVSGARGVTLVYRNDLSFNPMFDLPHSRFVRVTIYQVRPGHESEFEEAAKTVMATYQKANVRDMQWATYRANAGEMAGTFYVFRPVDTLEKLDPMANEQTMKAFEAALGEDGGKKLDKLMADGVVSAESNIFAFDPKISYAPPAFAAADSFWAVPASSMAQVGTSGKSTTVNKAKREKK